MSDAGPETPLRKTKLLIVVGCLLSLLAIGLILWLRNENLPSFVVLPADFTLKEDRPFPDRWLPRKWGAAWKLRYALLGQPPTFSLQTTIAKLDAIPKQNLEEIFLLTPIYSSNDFRVWLLPDNEIKAIRKSLDQNKVLASPNAMSGEGTVVKMSLGQTVPIDGKQQHVGVELSFVPLLRNGNTDLKMKTLSTDVDHPGAGSAVINTNISLASRVQIPKGHGALLLHPSAARASAILIGAEWK